MPTVGYVVDGSGARTPNLAAFPRTHIGMTFNGSQYVYRRWEDLWAAAGAPELGALSGNAITNLFDDPAGLYKPANWLGGTWHNSPNTDLNARRKTVDGQFIDHLDFGSSAIGNSRAHDYSPNSAGAVRWHIIEATQGVFVWSNFDKFISDHYALGRTLQVVLGFTPPWATSQPSYDNGAGVVSVYAPYASNPPDSMVDWSNYCSQVAARAYSLAPLADIYFEIWNEPNASQRWYNGTYAQLAEMQRVGYQAVKAAFPTAKVAAPAMAGIASTARDYFNTFFGTSDGAGGFARDWVDAVGFHTYYNSASGNWINFLSDYSALVSIWTSHGLNTKPRLFNEVGMSNPTFGALTQQERNKRFARMVITSACLGIDIFTYYDMDGAAPLYLGFQTYQRPEVAAALWNNWRDALLNREITRVNFLWDGSLAIIRNNERFLI